MSDLAAFLEVPWSDYRSDLVDALWRTVSYTVVSFVGAVLLGLAVALLRLSRAWAARAAAAVYTEVFKNVPLLAIIFLTYFGLASVGVRLDVFTAGCLSLVVFYAAYLSEIFRAAISGVHAGQTEAGEALGLGRAGIFGHVILPQAVRQALPGTNTMLVDLLKSTSLLVTVSAAELMSEGRSSPRPPSAPWRCTSSSRPSTSPSAIRSPNCSSCWSARCGPECPCPPGDADA